MKWLLKTYLILCAATLPAAGQTYNGVFSDTNYVILPGFTIPAAQVTGVVPSGNLSSNVMMWSGVASTGIYGVTLFGSNVTANAVRTANVLGTVQLTNGSVMASASLAVGYGTNALANYPGPGGIYASNFVLAPFFNGDLFGGTNNFTSQEQGIPNLEHSTIYGGWGNVVDGYLGGGGSIYTPCVIVGGAGGTCSGLSMTLIGGQNNALLDGGWGVIVGGRTNSYGQEAGAIVGGMNNTCEGTFSGVNGRNNVILGGHNNYIQTGISNSLVAGNYAVVAHSSTWVWADDQGNLPFASATNNSFIVRSANGVGINTNYPGTNALAVRGNVDVTSLSLQGTNLFLLLPLAAATNALYLQTTYDLDAASNILAAQSSATAYSNSLVAASVFANSIVTTNNLLATSNLLAAQALLNATSATNNLNAASNVLSAQISTVTASKAFSCTLTANYASLGIGFSTPLMPDGNYSVVLTPDDQTTAESPLIPWISSKTTSGFTLNVAYATNAYNLNYECIIKENSQ